jgi:hypothetical protein
MFILPNRKAFSDSITRIFLKYRKTDIDPLDTADSEEDLCARRGDMSKSSKELFSYQKIVREIEYLMLLKEKQQRAQHCLQISVKNFVLYLWDSLFFNWNLFFF